MASIPAEIHVQGSGNLERFSSTRESRMVRRVMVGRTMCFAGLAKGSKSDVC